MEKVPQAGYKIIGLPMAGIQRKLTASNLLLPFKILKSLAMAGNVLSQFKPRAVVGVGGYASMPVLYKAQQRGIPVLVQEQNGYAGLTNKLLARKASAICVAWPRMERYFPADRLIFTGNPVRKDIARLKQLKAEAYHYFDLSPDRRTLLVLGGSLGARTLNDSLLNGWKKLADAGFQVIWSTGKYYYRQLIEVLGEKPHPQIVLKEFITRMELAYACADVVVSRAGALSISELCLAGLPVVLVPSPNVAEDHQTKNARALVEEQAALLVPDADARQRLLPQVLHLLGDTARQRQLSRNIKKLARPEAAREIAEKVLELADR